MGFVSVIPFRPGGGASVLLALFLTQAALGAPPPSLADHAVALRGRVAPAGRTAPLTLRCPAPLRTDFRFSRDGQAHLQLEGLIERLDQLVPPDAKLPAQAEVDDWNRRLARGSPVDLLETDRANESSPPPLGKAGPALRALVSGAPLDTVLVQTTLGDVDPTNLSPFGRTVLIELLLARMAADRWPPGRPPKRFAERSDAASALRDKICAQQGKEESSWQKSADKNAFPQPEPSLDLALISEFLTRQGHPVSIDRLDRVLAIPWRLRGYLAGKFNEPWLDTGPLAKQFAARLQEAIERTDRPVETNMAPFDELEGRARALYILKDELKQPIDAATEKRLAEGPRGPVDHILTVADRLFEKNKARPALRFDPLSMQLVADGDLDPLLLEKERHQATKALEAKKEESATAGFAGADNSFAVTPDRQHRRYLDSVTAHLEWLRTLERESRHRHAQKGGRAPLETCDLPYSSDPRFVDPRVAPALEAFEKRDDIPRRYLGKRRPPVRTAAVVKSLEMALGLAPPSEAAIAGHAEALTLLEEIQNDPPDPRIHFRANGKHRDIDWEKSLADPSARWLLGKIIFPDGRGWDLLASFNHQPESTPKDLEEVLGRLITRSMGPAERFFARELYVRDGSQSWARSGDEAAIAEAQKLNALVTAACRRQRTALARPLPEKARGPRGDESVAHDLQELLRFHAVATEKSGGSPVHRRAPRAAVVETFLGLDWFTRQLLLGPLPKLGPFPSDPEYLKLSVEALDRLGSRPPPRAAEIAVLLAQLAIRRPVADAFADKGRALTKEEAAVLARMDHQKAERIGEAVALLPSLDTGLLASLTFDADGKITVGADNASYRRFPVLRKSADAAVRSELVAVANRHDERMLGELRKAVPKGKQAEHVGAILDSVDEAYRLAHGRPIAETIDAPEERKKWRPHQWEAAQKIAFSLVAVRKLAAHGGERVLPLPLEALTPLEAAEYRDLVATRKLRGGLRDDLRARFTPLQAKIDEHRDTERRLELLAATSQYLSKKDVLRNRTEEGRLFSGLGLELASARRRLVAEKSAAQEKGVAGPSAEHPLPQLIHAYESFRSAIALRIGVGRLPAPEGDKALEREPVLADVQFPSGKASTDYELKGIPLSDIEGRHGIEPKLIAPLKAAAPGDLYFLRHLSSNGKIFGWEKRARQWFQTLEEKVLPGQRTSVAKQYFADKEAIDKDMETALRWYGLSSRPGGYLILPPVGNPLREDARRVQELVNAKSGSVDLALFRIEEADPARHRALLRFFLRFPPSNPTRRLVESNMLPPPLRELFTEVGALADKHVDLDSPEGRLAKALPSAPREWLAHRWADYYAGDGPGEGGKLGTPEIERLITTLHDAKRERSRATHLPPPPRDTEYGDAKEGVTEGKEHLELLASVRKDLVDTLAKDSKQWTSPEIAARIDFAAHERLFRGKKTPGGYERSLEAVQRALILDAAEVSLTVKGKRPLDLRPFLKNRTLTDARKQHREWLDRRGYVLRAAILAIESHLALRHLSGGDSSKRASIVPARDPMASLETIVAKAEAILESHGPGKMPAVTLDGEDPLLKGLGIAAFGGYLDRYASQGEDVGKLHLRLLSHLTGELETMKSFQSGGHETYRPREIATSLDGKQKLQVQSIHDLDKVLGALKSAEKGYREWSNERAGRKRFPPLGSAASDRLLKLPAAYFDVLTFLASEDRGKHSIEDRAATAALLHDPQPAAILSHLLRSSQWTQDYFFRLFASKALAKAPGMDLIRKNRIPSATEGHSHFAGREEMRATFLRELVKVQKSRGKLVDMGSTSLTDFLRPGLLSKERREVVEKQREALLRAADEESKQAGLTLDELATLEPSAATAQVLLLMIRMLDSIARPAVAPRSTGDGKGKELPGFAFDEESAVWTATWGARAAVAAPGADTHPLVKDTAKLLAERENTYAFGGGGLGTKSRRMLTELSKEQQDEVHLAIDWARKNKGVHRAAALEELGSALASVEPALLSDWAERWLPHRARVERMLSGNDTAEKKAAIAALSNGNDPAKSPLGNRYLITRAVDAVLEKHPNVKVGGVEFDRAVYAERKEVRSSLAGEAAEPVLAKALADCAKTKSESQCFDDALNHLVLAAPGKLEKGKAEKDLAPTLQTLRTIFGIPMLTDEERAKHAPTITKDLLKRLDFVAYQRRQAAKDKDFVDTTGHASWEACKDYSPRKEALAAEDLLRKAFLSCAGESKRKIIRCELQVKQDLVTPALTPPAAGPVSAELTELRKIYGLDRLTGVEINTRLASLAEELPELLARIVSAHEGDALTREHGKLSAKLFTHVRNAIAAEREKSFIDIQLLRLRADIGRIERDKRARGKEKTLEKLKAVEGRLAKRAVFLEDLSHRASLGAEGVNESSAAFAGRLSGHLEKSQSGKARGWSRDECFFAKLAVGDAKDIEARNKISDGARAREAEVRRAYFRWRRQAEAVGRALAEHLDPKAAVPENDPLVKRLLEQADGTNGFTLSRELALTRVAGALADGRKAAAEDAVTEKLAHSFGLSVARLRGNPPDFSGLSLPKELGITTFTMMHDAKAWHSSGSDVRKALEPLSTAVTGSKDALWNALEGQIVAEWNTAVQPRFLAWGNPPYEDDPSNALAVKVRWDPEKESYSLDFLRRAELEAVVKTAKSAVSDELAKRSDLEADYRASVGHLDIFYTGPKHHREATDALRTNDKLVAKHLQQLSDLEGIGDGKGGSAETFATQFRVQQDYGMAADLVETMAGAGRDLKWKWATAGTYAALVFATKRIPGTQNPSWRNTALHALGGARTATGLTLWHGATNDVLHHLKVGEKAPPWEEMGPGSLWSSAGFALGSGMPALIGQLAKKAGDMERRLNALRIRREDAARALRTYRQGPASGAAYTSAVSTLERIGGAAVDVSKTAAELSRALGWRRTAHTLAVNQRVTAIGSMVLSDFAVNTGQNFYKDWKDGFEAEESDRRRYFTQNLFGALHTGAFAAGGDKLVAGLLPSVFLARFAAASTVNVALGESGHLVKAHMARQAVIEDRLRAGVELGRLHKALEALEKEEGTTTKGKRVRELQAQKAIVLNQINQQEGLLEDMAVSLMSGAELQKEIEELKGNSDPDAEAKSRLRLLEKAKEAKDLDSNPASWQFWAKKAAERSQDFVFAAKASKHASHELAYRDYAAERRSGGTHRQALERYHRARSAGFLGPRPGRGAERLLTPEAVLEAERSLATDLLQHDRGANEIFRLAAAAEGSGPGAAEAKESWKKMTEAMNHVLAEGGAEPFVSSLTPEQWRNRLTELRGERFFRHTTVLEAMEAFRQRGRTVELDEQQRKLDEAIAKTDGSVTPEQLTALRHERDDALAALVLSDPAEFTRVSPQALLDFLPRGTEVDRFLARRVMIVAAARMSRHLALARYFDVLYPRGGWRRPPADWPGLAAEARRALSGTPTERAEFSRTAALSPREMHELSHDDADFRVVLRARYRLQSPTAPEARLDQFATFVQSRVPGPAEAAGPAPTFAALVRAFEARP